MTDSVTKYKGRTGTGRMPQRLLRDGRQTVNTRRRSTGASTNQICAGVEINLDTVINLLPIVQKPWATTPDDSPSP